MPSPDISVVIPVRAGGSPEITLRSLAAQSYQDFDIVVSWDHDARGACWARNRGTEKVRTPFILFSDDDIVWEPRALKTLRHVLLSRPEASWSYGCYEIDGRIVGAQPFERELLQRKNYISTMSLILREHVPVWDEKITRLQDWDLWLTMLEQSRSAVYCGTKIFSTARKENGITYGSISWVEAERIVKAKHGLV